VKILAMSVVVTDETAAGACGISATRAMEAKKRQRLADPTLQEVDEESAVAEIVRNSNVSVNT
jgi:hypothetical protein